MARVRFPFFSFFHPSYQCYGTGYAAGIETQTTAKPQVGPRLQTSSCVEAQCHDERFVGLFFPGSTTSSYPFLIGQHHSTSRQEYVTLPQAPLVHGHRSLTGLTVAHDHGTGPQRRNVAERIANLQVNKLLVLFYRSNYSFIFSILAHCKILNFR